MFIFQRRYKCILCNMYHSKDWFGYTYLGIGICNKCLEEIKTYGDKSYGAKPPISYVIAPFYYDGRLKSAIKKYKFVMQRAYGILMGNILADELMGNSMIDGFDCVIPVPLHGLRYKNRGYNQSEKLAQILAERLEIPCITDGVFRIRETKQQSSLKATERAENVKDAFYGAESAIKGKSIILVDDIFTMGETMSACGEALKKAGADRVIGVALCKTKQKERPMFYR